MVGDILQPTHLLFVLIVALLVLGPKRLPEVGKTLGSGIRDFRQAISGETNHMQEWTQSINESPQRHQPTDEADAESTAVAEPVTQDTAVQSAAGPIGVDGTGEEVSTTGSAPDLGATTPVVERPAVLAGAQAPSQPARPATPVAGRTAPSPSRQPVRAQAGQPARAAARPVASGPRPARSSAGAPQVARPAPVRTAPSSSRPVQRAPQSARPAAQPVQRAPQSARPAAQPARRAPRPAASGSTPATPRRPTPPAEPASPDRRA